MATRSILFVNRVFPPDRGATGRCLADLAGAFVRAGWRVGVLAAGRGSARVRAGVTVWRCAPLGDPAACMSGLDGRLAAAALRLPRHDIVVTMTDPPLLALLGPLLAATWRARLIHWSHDLYPDLFPVIGRPLASGAADAAMASMAGALAAHDAVVAIGPCMARRLAGRGIDSERIAVIANWADPLIRPNEPGSAILRGRLGLGQRFVVGYAGNFGLAHPLDRVVDVAGRLERRLPEAVFLMVGDGRGRPGFERMVMRRRLANVVLHPWQPDALVGAMLGAVDLHLAVMVKAAEGMMVPSKVAGVLAAGRPCLFLGPAGSSAADRIRRSGAGDVVDPDDGQAIADRIERLARDRVRWLAACAAARRERGNHGFVQGAGRFLALAERLVESGRGACAGGFQAVGGPGDAGIRARAHA
ncbi:MAG TPA: glycosyltransferase family 4 protein [Arenibaculum sp.]|nr:glycosyltransferase family 4 protein [Arenibaculum sp.]